MRIHDRSEKPKVGLYAWFRKLVDGMADDTRAAAEVSAASGRYSEPKQARETEQRERQRSGATIERAEDVGLAVRAQHGGNLPQELNVRDASLLKNTASKRAFNILSRHLTDASWTRIGDGLGKRLERAGITAKNRGLLSEYALALHSLDRDAQNKPVFGKDITADERRALIADVQANHPEVVAAEQAWQDFRKEFLQAFLVDTGYVSQADFDNMNAMYPHYVPTQRVKDSGKDSIWHRGGSKKYQIRSAKGSTEDIWDPMDTFAGMVDSVVTMVSANNAALAWDRAYQQNEGLAEFGREIGPDSEYVSVDVSNLQAQIAELLSGNVTDDIFQRVVDLIGTEQGQWKTKNGASVPNVLTVQRADGTKAYYEMHKARVLATAYYHNSIYRLEGSEERFALHIPRDWALEIVPEAEYDMLCKLVEKDGRDGTCKSG